MTTDDTTPNMAAAGQENDNNNNPNNPFEGMTEDDPNFVYKVHYEKYHDLINNLPSGWTRGDNEKNNEAPYIHEDGRVSYRNPNWKKIKSFMKEMDDLKRQHLLQQEEEEEEEEGKEATTEKMENTASSSSSPSWRQHPKRSMIKKLRLMLTAAGAPLEVVERRAAMEGIDMDLVLQQRTTTPDEGLVTVKKDLVDAADGAEGNADGDAATVSPSPNVSSFLLKKYKRMIKVGIPLPQVQQLASIEANLSPEQVVKYCVEAPSDASASASAATVAATPEKIETSTTPTMNPNSPRRPRHDREHQLSQQGRDHALAKLKKMQKAGIPEAALELSARSMGISMEDLLVDEPIIVDESKDEPPASELPFTAVGSQRVVTFDGSSDLAGLVRKLVQTVKKSSRVFSTGAAKGQKHNKNEMVVDVSTLYHALGSFQGVQISRDRYNATAKAKTTGTELSSMSLKYVRSQREAFVEIARSIGLDLPKNLNTSVDIIGLDELVEFIQGQFKSEIDEFQNLIREGFYNFECLGCLYPAGSRVLVKNAGGGGVDTLAKVAWNRYEEGRTILGQTMKVFKVALEYVVAVDSNAATICEVVESYEQFEGKRLLTGNGMLQLVPLSAFSTEQQTLLIERYRRRGQLYNRVALNVQDKASDQARSDKYSYMQYQKGCFFAKRSSGGGFSGGNATAALASEGRIIVDARSASDAGHSLSIGYDPFVTGIKYKVKEYKLESRTQASEQSQGLGRGKDSVRSNGGDSGMILFDYVPDSLLEFTWPLVLGFSLAAGCWGDCLVDGLEDIQFQSEVFDRLVLPSSRKRLVQALVKHNGQDSGMAFHDLIAGKGEGTVFLLHGKPGCGKTLTAEATAEVLRRPLYALSMGTMGTTADELERRLSEILSLSAKWDAIILLDEADSFLETRSSSSSLEKNAMVSVMLKLVEYFSGILFLTSNRIDSIDPAFKTRITLSLKYEQLDVSGREMIWNNLLLSSGVDAMSNSINTGILASSFVLNGREIKNALRLALALAAEEGLNAPSHSILMETAAMVGPYQDDNSENSKKDIGCFFPWWK
mmetsp:Transcript_30278/g.73700  ORF Transcript_30278/g.73700 Transcript_30278/m.73700 type:complete len:1058 (-) Transcript_30278:143-3316(-)